MCHEIVGLYSGLCVKYLGKISRKVIKGLS